MTKKARKVAKRKVKKKAKRKAKKKVSKKREAKKKVAKKKNKASSKKKTSGDDKGNNTNGQKVNENEGDICQGKLNQLRIAARNYPLNILVWGPDEDGSEEYAARCTIRDELIRRGHNAKFSEEYCGQKNALKNPIHDEMLQADCHDAIVMMYGSRGTQTEIDRIVMENKIIANKTTVLIRDSMLNRVDSSLSGESWRQLVGAAKIIKYTKLPLEQDVLEDISELLQKLREMKFIERNYKRKDF